MKLAVTMLALCSVAGPACVAPSEAPGWIALFNGVDLHGWTPKIRGYPAGDNFGDTFRVEGGVLKVGYGGYASFDNRFGHLFYDTPFSSYLLRVEYRFVGAQVPGAPGWALRNSGIMVHGQSADSMELDQEFPVSIEVQLLGGNGRDPRPTANVCTPGTHVEIDGAIAPRHCMDSSSATYHGDRWVAVEIEVRGHDSIEHRVEGRPVLRYRRPQLDGTDVHAQRLGAPGALLSSGTISLQSEGHGVEFRRVDLLPLE